MNADEKPLGRAGPAEPDVQTGLSLAELAADEEAARIVARLTRTGGEAEQQVDVAAFNSFI